MISLRRILIIAYSEENRALVIILRLRLEGIVYIDSGLNVKVKAKVLSPAPVAVSGSLLIDAYRFYAQLDVVEGILHLRYKNRLWHVRLRDSASPEPLLDSDAQDRRRGVSMKKYRPTPYTLFRYCSSSSQAADYFFENQSLYGSSNSVGKYLSYRYS
ncbi:hypothetical protein ANO14919_028310 [Xylariales sp. No.14919]|nr:hypothetical protein ANO14919_028310 [Xylariales sp. No.14919]